MKWPRSLTFPREPDVVIGDFVDDRYMERWFVVPRNRVFNIYLHRFLRSDDLRALHDHPWINMSILLGGRYIEVTPGGRKLRKPFRPVCRLPTWLHRVELIDDKPVLSLFLTGPKVRSWGFQCPQGWVPWKKFVEVTPYGNKMGKGCDQ